MFRITSKDLKLFFADKKAILLTFLLPIFLISLFALAFGGSGKRESKPVSLVVADADNSAASKEIMLKLDSLPGLEVEKKELNEARNLVKKGDRPAVLVLHKGLSDSISQGKNPFLELQYDAAKEAEIGILQAALMGNLVSIVGIKNMEKTALANISEDFPGMDSSTKRIVQKRIRENFAQAGPGNEGPGGMDFLKATPLIAEEENSPGLVQAVAGTAIMMLLFSVSAMGASLLDEKQEGTLKKLLYSPLSPGSILLGKMFSSNIISIAQLTIMFLFAWLVFGLNISQNLPALILMILCTAYACSGFGVFLASVARSRQQVSGLSTLIILVMSAIGGSMIPTFIMPVFMQKMAMFSVNYWGIQGFYDIFWRQLEISDPVFLSRIAVLTGTGSALNFIAVRLFKKNILKIA